MVEDFQDTGGDNGSLEETLAEFDIEIEHRPGLVHSNVDGVSRPFCKPVSYTHLTLPTIYSV